MSTTFFIIISAISALAQTDSFEVLKKHADNSLAPINYLFSSTTLSTAKDFADWGKRFETTQGFKNFNSPLLRNCNENNNNIVFKNGRLMTEEAAQEYDEIMRLAPPGWRLSLLIDSSVIAGGKTQNIPPVLNGVRSTLYSEYFSHFQNIGQEFSANQTEERKKRFQEVLLTGWYESGIRRPSFIEALGLDPKNPEHFESFVWAFSQLIGLKRYSNIKLIDDSQTEWGVIDALTTFRDGVCTDYALWNGELLAMAGVSGWNFNDFKQNFSSISHSTIGGGHAMGQISNPNTKEQYTINYGQVLKLQNGDLVPFDMILNDKEFGFTNAGIGMNRGNAEKGKNGRTIINDDQMSGYILTPFGKELQETIYQGSDFENLKIKNFSGVMQSTRATGGLSLQKQEGVNEPSIQSFDVAVTQYKLGGIAGRPEIERTMVWTKYKYSELSERENIHFQFFVGAGHGTQITKFGMTDIAIDYQPRRIYDLKFLAPDAKITFEGNFGMRSFIYLQGAVGSKAFYKKQERTDMVLVDQQGNPVASYNPNDRTYTEYAPGNPSDPNYKPFTPYKVRDNQTGEQWFWEDHGEITPYNYVYDRSEKMEQASVSGNTRFANSLRSTIELNENVTIFGEGSINFAPSPKSLSAFRGDAATKPSSYYLATEQGFKTGGTVQKQVSPKTTLQATGSFKKMFNPFGDRQLTQLRLDRVTKGNDYYVYFNSSRFNDNTQSGANHFDEYGLGYTGSIFKGATGGVNFGIIHYPQTDTQMIQGSMRMNLGRPTKKKKR